MTTIKLKITISHEVLLYEFLGNLELLNAKLIGSKAIGPAGGNPQVIIELEYRNLARAKQLFQNPEIYVH